VPSGGDAYKHYVSDLKTIEESGFWVRYNSVSVNYSAVIDSGQLGKNDISAELYIHTDNKAYLILKNNLRDILDATPIYKLSAKYTVNVVEYTTARTNEII